MNAIPRYLVKHTEDSADFNFRDETGELHLMTEEPIELTLLQLGMDGLQHPSLVCVQIIDEIIPEPTAPVDAEKPATDTPESDNKPRKRRR